MEEVSQLALPFLLIVNSAQLLSAHEGYKNQLIINSVAMAGVCALFYLVFYRYTVGNLAMLIQEPSEALPTVKSGLSLVLPYGFFAFNIFVDLFLCTLTMIFLNYNPRRVFTGDDVPAREEALKEEKMNASIDSGIRLSKAVGFGGSFYLIFLAPVVLLFCYTRQPKNPLTDILIPVAGVFLILFVYIEGFHQLLGHLPIEKVNLKEFKDMVAFYIGMLL